MKFYHHRLQGLLANYRAEHGYVEFAIDWEGFRTEKQREKFRILSEGRWHDDRFYAGYSLMVLHYAKTLDETEDQGVVDNMLINPMPASASTPSSTSTSGWAISRACSATAAPGGGSPRKGASSTSR